MFGLTDVQHCLFEEIDQSLLEEGLLLGRLLENVSFHIFEDCELDELDDDCSNNEEVPRVNVVLQLLPALVGIARSQQEWLED